MNISDIKNKILNIGIVLLGCIIAFNIYKDQMKDINFLKERNESESKKNQLLEEIGILSKEVQLYKKFINNKEIKLIINTLRNIAKESSVKIVAIKPAVEQKYPQYTKYPFDLTVETENYHFIGKFISELESHPDIYLVNSAVINSAVQETMSVTLHIETVLFGDQK